METLNLSGCNNPELSVYLAAVRSLKSLDLSRTATSKPIEFSEGFNSLTSLNLYSSNVKAFKYGTKDVSTYEGEQVLDLSKFKLTGLDVRYNSSKYIKFNNSKTQPLNISSLTFTGCTSLIRVFGHIVVSNNTSFNGLNNFTIHGRDNNEYPTKGAWYGPDTDVSSTTWDDDSDLQTNFNLTATSLNNKFQKTNCNMFDVYYILQKCSAVTSLYYTFAECWNAVTDLNNPLRRDTFAECGNVTNTSSLFYATRVAGPLYSAVHNGTSQTGAAGLIQPLKNLTNPTGMFSSSGTKYIDDMFFYFGDLKFTNITSFFAHDRGDNV